MICIQQMKYARLAHLPCWTDNKLYLVHRHLSPRIIPHPMSWKEMGLVGCRKQECPCLNQTAGRRNIDTQVLLVRFTSCVRFFPRRASEHICTTRSACKHMAPRLLQINVAATNICACQVNGKRCSDKCRHTHTHKHTQTHTNTHTRTCTPEWQIVCAILCLRSYVHCKANSCSSKSNSSNRLCECVAWCVCALVRMCVSVCVCVSSCIPNTHALLQDSE